MNPNTRALQAPGQSLWIDDITRTMLADGTLRRYVADLSITGPTSNPTLFDRPWRWEMLDPIEFGREFFESLLAVDEAIVARAAEKPRQQCGGAAAPRA